MESQICVEKVKRCPFGILVVNHEEGGAAVVVHAKDVKFEAASEADDVESSADNFPLEFGEEVGDFARVVIVEGGVKGESERPLPIFQGLVEHVGNVLDMVVFDTLDDDFKVDSFEGWVELG